MKLRTSLFASLAVAALAVPVASVTALTLTTTPAFAKSGNNKGGNRANRGGSRKPTADRTSRGNSSNAGGNGKSQAAPARSASAKPEPAPASAESTELHPSQLGSMNGALHANINAVAAHIRNGNTNGPVGALAALAVARTSASGAQSVIDAAEAYARLEQDLTNAVAASEYVSLDDYLAAKEAASDDFETDSDIELALAALQASPTPPTDLDVASAQEALTAETTAEEGILAAWNKSDEASEEEQQALLTALRDRIDAESEAIADAIEAANASSEPDLAGETDLVEEVLPEEELASQQ